MKLPIEISPDPLVISTIEIRFVPKIEDANLLPLVYKHFQELTPNLEQSKIPLQIKKSDKNFQYAPDFSLNNNQYKFSFSNCVLSFENISNYSLWNNYFSFISNVTNTFINLNIIGNIERIGVRYASIFNEITSVQAVFNFDQKINLNGYNEIFEQFKTNLVKEDINFLVQIFANAEANKAGNFKKGVCIDIDASVTPPNLPVDQVLNTIDRLHKEEKIVFFSLLRQEFLNSLNPKY